MSARHNAELAHAIYDAFNRNDLDAALQLATDDVEISFIPFGQTFRGREGFRAFMQGFRSAFPDIRIQVTNQVATDQGVVNEFTWTGTHTGPLAAPAGEVPPTGRVAGYPVCEVWEVRNGRLAAIRNYQNAATLLQQLGVVPDPAEEAKNLAVLERAREQWNLGNLEGYLELYDESCTVHGPPGIPPGKASVRAFYQAFMAAFPGNQLGFDEVLAHGDRILSRFTVRGTQHGEFQGIPPTGKSVEVTGMTILRFAGGKCVERWNQADFLGMLQQLGAVPAPAGG
ncbi:MAG: ester cyclase [Gemmatimonadetes bacterium]|nr:ester cyclase [Gemmatimonadota bacterium]